MTDPILALSTPHGRFYAHPVKRSQVPSITNIIGKKDKPGIKYWVGRECGEYVAENLAKLGHLDRDEVIQLVRNAPFGKSDASNVGDIVHNWIDSFIKGQPVSDEERASAPLPAQRMYRQFGGFCDRYKPEFVDSEFTVWSDAYQYAGTGDFAARIGGALVLVDTKTGKNVYPEVGMQLAAISYADYVLKPDGTESPVPSFGKFAVLHLRPTFSRLIPVENIRACFAAFLGLKAVFDFDLAAEDVLRFAPKIETPAAA